MEPQKELALPQTVTQIMAFLNILPDALIAINHVGAIVMSNTQADELFGYSHNEMLQMHVDMLLPERFRARHAQHRRHYFLAPQARLMGTGLKLYGLRKDGTEFPVDISLRPVTVENDGMAAIAVIKDITNMSSLAERVEQLTKIIQERTITPVLELTGRVSSMEQRMDVYEAKIVDMQVKLTEVGDATKANQIVLEDIQDNMKTLQAIEAGIENLKNFMKRACIWLGGILAGAASIALAALIVNYFHH
jgi:PAS domain S-box-containing protein